MAVMSTRDLDPQELKGKYGLDLKIYNDYDRFLADPEIDIVDICTPSFLHSEQSIAAANAGKDLIIEKPLALTYEETKRMREAIQKNNTRTSVCFEVRFVSSAQATKSIIEQGLIGDPYYAEADYYHGIGPWYANQRWEVEKSKGGSSLLRAGCHALDIIRYLTGGEVEEVFAYGNTNPHEVFRPYDYELNTVALLKFTGGLVGKVSSCTDSMHPYVFNMNILGSHGAVRNDEFHSKKIAGLEGWTKLGVELIDSGEVTNHPYSAQFEYFAECLDRGVDPHNNFEDAFVTHQVIYAVDKSAAEGRPVRLSEFA